MVTATTMVTITMVATTKVTITMMASTKVTITMVASTKVTITMVASTMVTITMVATTKVTITMVATTKVTITMVATTKVTITMVATTKVTITMVARTKVASRSEDGTHLSATARSRSGRNVPSVSTYRHLPSPPPTSMGSCNTNNFMRLWATHRRVRRQVTSEEHLHDAWLTGEERSYIEIKTPLSVIQPSVFSHYLLVI